eukprot:102416_1
MLPTKQLLSKTIQSAPIVTHSARACITGVNSPYFQIEHAPWSFDPVFRDTAVADPFPVFRCLDWDGKTVDPNFTLPFSENELIEMYTNMLSVQCFDETFYRLARAGYISFYSQNSGEEALQVGSSKAWNLDDVLFFQYRELGVFLQRGFPVQQCADVCFSNNNDFAKGRQMPVHYGSKDLNCVTVSSTLATQMPQAAGAGYAIKRSGKDACAVCYFGDGAASEGDAHAAFNLTATTESPVVWLCRNNGYAISTPTQDQYRGDGIAARGYGYGMYVNRFDGNDIFATYLACKQAREIVIKEQRPVIMEGMTYRGSHHSTSDDSKTYRCDNEEHKWRTYYNPIRRLRVFMEKELLWTEQMEKELTNDVQSKIDDVARIGQRTIKPHWKHAIHDTFDKMTPRLQSQMDELEQHLEEFGKEEYYKLHEHSHIKL